MAIDLWVVYDQHLMLDGLDGICLLFELKKKIITSYCSGLQFFLQGMLSALWLIMVYFICCYFMF